MPARERGREEKYGPCVAKAQAAEKQRARQAIPKTGVQGEARGEIETESDMHMKERREQGTERKGKGERKAQRVRERPSHRKERKVWWVGGVEGYRANAPRARSFLRRSKACARSCSPQVYRSLVPPMKKSASGHPLVARHRVHASTRSPLAHRSWPTFRKGVV